MMNFIVLENPILVPGATYVFLILFFDGSTEYYIQPVIFLIFFGSKKGGSSKGDLVLY